MLLLNLSLEVAKETLEFTMEFISVHMVAMYMLDTVVSAGMYTTLMY